MDDDPNLRAALDSAVADVEPSDRLTAIRRHTLSSTRRRRGWYAAGGSCLAAAAAVTVIVAVTQPGATTVADPAATNPVATTPPISTPGTEGVTPSPPDVADSTRSVYYVGPGPSGPTAPASALYLAHESAGSVLETLTAVPSDPDYRTLWPAGSLLAMSDPEAGTVIITIPESLAQRPDGMSEEDAALALQQVAYTIGANHDPATPEELRLTIQFRTEGGITQEALGIDIGLGFQRADALEVLSHMSITEPAEGTVIPAGSDSFTATGQGNSFEASGACFLRGDDGFEAGPYLAQMSGWMAPRLFPWEATVDLSDVPPGTYTFACSTDDPTGGAEGRGTDTDTRTVIVE